MTEKKFKETEIGLIPEDWHLIPLGKLITFKRGHDLPIKERKKGKYPIIASNGIVGYHNEFKAKGPGVIIGRSGNLGKPFYIEDDYWPLNTTLYSINFHDSDPKFVYYFLKTIPLNEFNSGSAVPSLNRNHIHTLEIIVPKKPTEQQKIASILSALDNKIKLNSQINKNLEEQIHLIFKNWFVDFQPFKNCKFKNSSFGEIPKEWKIYDFKDFLKIRVEKSNKQNIPKFSITNNGIQNRDEKFKKNLSSPSSKFKLVYKNDLIFGMSREILNWGLMNDEIGGVSSAYNVFIIEKLNPRYLESFIKHRIVYFKDIIKPASREGQGIDKNILFDKQIYVPPNNIIEDYYRIEDKFVNLINNNNKEIDNLASLRDILIHKLISGEVDVSNVEI
jgi:type I restriction enzyme S subunit